MSLALPAELTGSLLFGYATFLEKRNHPDPHVKWWMLMGLVSAGLFVAAVAGLLR